LRLKTARPTVRAAGCRKTTQEEFAVVATSLARTRWPGLVHALWLVPLVLLSIPTGAFLWHQWTKSVWVNSHGMLVPFLVAFLAWDALKREPVKEEEPSGLGFLFLVPALALVALDAAIRTGLLAAFGMLLALPGLSLLLLGPRRTRALLFPFLLAFFMLPIPAGLLAPVQLVLRTLTAHGTRELLYLVGTPVYLQGLYLMLPKTSLYVADACSGFSTLYATMTMALVLAYLGHSWVRRILLLVVAAPLAIACNAVRVTALALLVEAHGVWLLDTTIHPLTGWLTFALAAVVLFFIAERGTRSQDA
jgi:exosortase